MFFTHDNPWHSLLIANFFIHLCFSSPVAMETTPKISIIVPVYNMEKYLRQCVDSILAQTFTDFELLLVNDGSKDSSAAICDAYASADSRVKVIHKENSGQADSRNIAIGMAKAPLIGFIDSDDWIDPDMYETLYHAMVENDADISMCGHYLSYLNHEIPSCQGGQIKVYDGYQALQMIIDDKEIKSYLVDKLYKKEMITELLPKSYYYEDYATLFKWFVGASRVAICNAAKYHYRQRQGSTDHDSDPRKKYHFFLAEQERYNYLTANNIFPEQHRMFAAKLVRAGLREIKHIVRNCSESVYASDCVDAIKQRIFKYKPMTVSDIGLLRRILLWCLEKHSNAYYKIIGCRIRCGFACNSDTKEFYD